MNSLIGLGKYLFALPIVVFGIFHFMNASDMAALAPFGGVAMVYLTGVALILAGVSIIIGKLDKLAAVLLAVMMLLFIIPHAQMLSEDPTQMANILKNISISGGALAYASLAKDKAIIN